MIIIYLPLTEPVTTKSYELGLVSMKTYSLKEYFWFAMLTLTSSLKLHSVLFTSLSSENQRQLSNWPAWLGLIALIGNNCLIASIYGGEQCQSTYGLSTFWLPSQRGLCATKNRNSQNPVSPNKAHGNIHLFLSKDHILTHSKLYALGILDMLHPNSRDTCH